jgi:hypothetical protein
MTTSESTLPVGPAAFAGSRSKQLRTRPVWSKSEISPAGCVLYTLAWQVLSFALISAQFFLLYEFGPLTLLLGMIGMIVLYVRLPLAGVTVFIQLLLYQNFFLCLFSDIGMDRLSFQSAQGTAFGAVACLAVIAVARVLQSHPRDDAIIRLTLWTCLTLAVVVIYAAYGAVGSSTISAITYFRNTSAMLLALLVGLDLGRRWGYRTVANIFLISVLFGTCIGIFEMLFPYTYYSALNVLDYVNLKSNDGGPHSILYSVDALVRSRVVTWFNITGGGTDLLSVRVGGPNMHPVSYAYVIAVTGIVAATTGRYVALGLCVTFLVLAGIKGPLLMLLFSIALFIVWQVSRRRSILAVLSVICLAVYVDTGIEFGLSRGDFHVLGFLGGLRSLLTLPQGHGIGVGGNLSALAGGGLDWQEWQKTGVDFALESAVGVLLYQMGVSAIAVITPAVALVKTAFGRAAKGRPGTARWAQPEPVDILFIAIAVILANGIFQEEAYSPYGLGLLTLLGAIAASNRVSIKQPVGT